MIEDDANPAQSKPPHQWEEYIWRIAEMNDIKPILSQMNIIAGNFEATIAVYRRLGVDISNGATPPEGTRHAAAIFPNGMIPSIAQLTRAMEGLFVVEDLHNFGPDYDRTLMAWYDNFERSWPGLKKRYDDRFYRMWRFYLLSSAGGFRARSNQLWHVVMTRPGTPQPDCRIT